MQREHVLPTLCWEVSKSPEQTHLPRVCGTPRQRNPRFVKAPELLFWNFLVLNFGWHRQTKASQTQGCTTSARLWKIKIVSRFSYYVIWFLFVFLFVLLFSSCMRKEDAKTQLHIESIRQYGFIINIKALDSSKYMCGLTPGSLQLRHCSLNNIIKYKINIKFSWGP